MWICEVDHLAIYIIVHQKGLEFSMLWAQFSGHIGPSKSIHENRPLWYNFCRDFRLSFCRAYL